MPTSRQLGLSSRGHRGGYRAKAGRKKIKDPADRKGHHPRPPLASRYPVHVTLKVLPGTPHLRRGQCFRVLRRCFMAGRDRFGFRLVHFTTQGNHLHLLCEANDKLALTRGMQGLAIRIAKNLNKTLDRSGRVFAQRYHERILKSPTEVRRALAYVLLNARRHAAQSGVLLSRNWIDPYSTAAWFDGWQRPIRADEPWMRELLNQPCPAAPATRWLLTTGWRRLGLLGLDEVPGGRATKS